MNLVVFPLIAAWTVLCIVLSPALFFILKITTRKDTDQITRLLIWIYGRGWLVIMAPFVRFKRMGLHREDIRPPCIMVSNHTSFFDIYCMALFPFSNVSFTVRKWPYKMIWYAPFMHMAGYLNVESMNWEKTSETAAKILSKGAGILWYPEAHRSPNGKLQRFYSGAFKLAIETGVKIVPVCILGTHQVLPPGRWWLKPARITVKALEPLNPKAFNDPFAHRTLKNAAWSQMDQALGEMAANVGNSAGVVKPLTSS